MQTTRHAKRTLKMKFWNPKRSMTIARNELIGKEETKSVCGARCTENKVWGRGVVTCIFVCLVVFLTISPSCHSCICCLVLVFGDQGFKMEHALHIAIMFPCVCVCVFC